jgi:predicted phage terminase large subunit-like protein
MLILCTRWHVDDVLGRYLEKEPGTRVVRFPAIAESDETYRKVGGPLFPELKSREFLLERNGVMSEASWQSIYQQNPYVVGGGVIPIEKLRIIPIWNRSKVRRCVLAVDKTATEGGDGAYTCFLVMHDLGPDEVPRYIIQDVHRGRWSALDRELKLRQFAEMVRASFRPRYVDFRIAVEQEPGSGGKESAETTARNLSGFNVKLDKVTGSKEVRAEPFVAQVQGGNVGLVAGPWIPEFLHEAEPWPNAKFLDQIDAAAMAFSHLTMNPGLDYSKAFA